MSNYRPNVAALIVDERGRVLVCERFKIPGAWQFPQGGVDEGEEWDEALRRRSKRRSACRMRITMWWIGRGTIATFFRVA